VTPTQSAPGSCHDARFLKLGLCLLATRSPEPLPFDPCLARTSITDDPNGVRVTPYARKRGDRDAWSDLGTRSTRLAPSQNMEPRCHPDLCDGGGYTNLGVVKIQVAAALHANASLPLSDSEVDPSRGCKADTGEDMHESARASRDARGTTLASSREGVIHEENDQEGDVSEPDQDDQGAHAAPRAPQKQANMVYFDTHPDRRPILTSDEAYVRLETTAPTTSSSLTPRSGRDVCPPSVARPRIHLLCLSRGHVHDAVPRLAHAHNLGAGAQALALLLGRRGRVRTAAAAR
jgi:hypothetical protein